MINKIEKTRMRRRRNKRGLRRKIKEEDKLDRGIYIASASLIG